MCTRTLVQHSNCTGAGRSVRRAIHGTRPTSDELCGTVLSTSAGDTGTAVLNLQLASQLEATRTQSSSQPPQPRAGASQSQLDEQGPTPPRVYHPLHLPAQLPPEKLVSHAQLSPGQTSASLRATSSGTVGCAREKGGAGQGRQTSRHRSPKRPAAADRVRHRRRPRSRCELPPSVAARCPCQRSLAGENARLPHRTLPARTQSRGIILTPSDYEKKGFAKVRNKHYIAEPRLKHDSSDLRETYISDYNSACARIVLCAYRSSGLNQWPE